MTLVFIAVSVVLVEQTVRADVRQVSTPDQNHQAAVRIVSLGLSSNMPRKGSSSSIATQKQSELDRLAKDFQQKASSMTREQRTQYVDTQREELRQWEQQHGIEAGQVYFLAPIEGGN